jgi:hypothetical protein
MQPNNQQPNPAASPRPGSEANLHPDIVSNIPLKAQAAPLTPIHEDQDLDKIMRDVGQDLKQNEKSHHKKRFFEFKRQPKAVKPAPRPTPAPSRPAPVQAKAAAQPKPARQSSAPVFTITLTIIVTGVLIAAAYYAYK